MNTTRAISLATVLVEDPDSREGVELAVYKDPVSRGLFAVDASFIEQVSVFVPGIYNSGTLQLDEPDDAERHQAVPVSAWPGEQV